MRLRTHWSAEEDEALRQGYGLGLPMKRIARQLHRTVPAIGKRACRLRIPLVRNSKPWTPREDAYLSTHYGTKTFLEISAVIARTPTAIESRSWKMKLGDRAKRPQGKAWKEGDDFRLRLIYLKAPLRLIAKQLGRTEQATYGRAVKLGLGVLPKGKPSKARYVEILKEECEQDKVPLSLALSKARTRIAAYARFRTWARLRRDGYSFPGIGAIAQLDHTSIIHGTRALARLMGSR